MDSRKGKISEKRQYWKNQLMLCLLDKERPHRKCNKMSQLLQYKSNTSWLHVQRYSIKLKLESGHGAKVQSITRSSPVGKRWWPRVSLRSLEGMKLSSRANPAAPYDEKPMHERTLAIGEGFFFKIKVMNLPIAKVCSQRMTSGKQYHWKHSRQIHHPQMAPYFLYTS